MPTDMIHHAGWGFFLRALALEIDAHGGPDGRDVLLRGVGQRLAQTIALPAVSSLEAFELEINAVLTTFGWGSCALETNETERCVMIRHTGLPVIGSSGEPAGLWLAAALEGLYETWLTNHPECGDGFVARRQTTATAAGQVLLRFEKETNAR